VLGVSGIAFASFNCVVGAGIFGLPALAAAALGPAAILGYLLSAVLLVLVGLCLAEIGSRVTEAGGPFAYATVSFGPVIGGVVGTLTWASLLAITGAFRSLAVFTSSTTLVIYSICCLGLLALRSRNVEQAGVSFRVPGGPIVPLIATALVGCLLFSLRREDLLATLVSITVSALVYGVLAMVRRAATVRASVG
jgi:amino acid transporter